MENTTHNRRAFIYLMSFLFLILNTDSEVIARDRESRVCDSAGGNFYTTSNIIHAKGAFYAVDWKSRVLRSTNGDEWSVFKVKDKSLQLFDIAWNGEYFVVASMTRLYRSEDAKTWQEVLQITGGVGIPKLRAYEGTFYLLGSFDDRTGPMFYSNDNGLTWKIETAFMGKHAVGGWDVTDLIQVNKEYYYTLEPRRMSWAIPKVGPSGWHMVESTSRDREREKELRRITAWLAYGNSRFVAAERNGNRVLTSDDGHAWKERALGFQDRRSRYFTDLEWTGKEFLLVGHEGTLLRSETGEEWSRDEVSTNGTLSGIASNGEIHIAVGDPPLDCSKSTSVLVSRDGKNWENVSDKIDQAIHAAEHTVQNPEKTE